MSTADKIEMKQFIKDSLEETLARFSEIYIKRNNLILNKQDEIIDLIEGHSKKIEDFYITPLGLCTNCKQEKR